MKVILLILFLAICQCSQKILQLNASTFTMATEEFEYLLVYFYDQSCEQCAQQTSLFRTANAMSVEYPQPELSE